MKIKTLIHTALVAEAKPIIGHFGLISHIRQPYNIYVGDEIVLVVSGMGSTKTQAALTYVLSLYQPQQAINIGIAGCKDPNMKKGSLFCTTHTHLEIPFASLSSHQNPINSAFDAPLMLVDMEGETFLQTIPQTIKKYIFKVVSDHLEPTIPSKAEVGAWIAKSIKYWGHYV